MWRSVSLCAAAVALAVFGLAGMAKGSIIHIPMAPVSGLDALPGVGWTAVQSAPTITAMVNQDLRADVYSQAYRNSSGQYAYLYQVNNTGTPAEDAVELFTVSPFAGADQNTVVGYFTGATVPDGFVGDAARMPQSQAALSGTAGSRTLSIYFTADQEALIEPGEHSSIMYALSNIAPGQIQGNIIDGKTASGLVFGAVPEPSCAALLLVGATALLRRRRVLKSML